MEKIEARYKPLSGPFHHKYIVYTDSTGEQFYARGGPTYNNGNPVIDLSRAQLPGDAEAFGDLETQYGLHTE